MIFKFGFIYKGLRYGWYQKKLYRLPYTNDAGYHLTLREVKSIMVGSNVGYRVGQDKKTINQLLEMTEIIDYELNVFNDKDVPF